MRKTTLAIPCLGIVLSCTPLAIAADPWADQVVNYVEGTGVGTDWVTGNLINNPQTAIGAPTRYTSDPDHYGGPTTPFSSAYRDDEVVTIGYGGSITLKFDEPVLDHPLNPFGIDLLVFGNAFLELDFLTNRATNKIFDDGGLLEVSANGVHFESVPISADGLFPTIGYLDVTDPLATEIGSAPSDFTKPVNPSFDPRGLTLAEIIAGYNGSGGGVGVDISSTGLSSISYVRISNLTSAQVLPEIDAIADVAAVPEPATLGMVAVAAAGIFFRRRR